LKGFKTMVHLAARWYSWMSPPIGRRYEKRERRDSNPRPLA
jgi:hypothetical protein